MSTDDEIIQLLLNLGLSYSQSKIWLTLNRFVDANVTEVARNVKIDRSEVSRVMQKLQKLGLIDEIISVPRRFKALSLKEGVSKLLQDKKLEYQKLVESTEFFSKFDSIVLKENVENNYVVLVLSGLDRLIEYSEKAAANVEKSSDLCGDWRGFRHLIYEKFKGLNKMLKKGVRFRIVVKQPSNDSAIEEFKNFARKYTNVEIRFFELSEELLFLWLFDKKEIVFAKMADDFQSRNQSQEQVLTSDAPAIIQMGQAYFEHVWHNAKPLEV